MVVATTAVQHYLYGITVARIVKLLKHQHGFTITGGALVKAWQRLAALLQADYDKIRLDVVDHARVRHGDETSWQIVGVTAWLVAFVPRHRFTT